MRDKAKLLPIFALILALSFDVGAAPDNLDEGVLKESRIKRLQQIAEIDDSTGMPRGGVYQSDPIKFEEYKYLEGKVEYKNIFTTFNKAFERLVNKVNEFKHLNLKNINLPLDSVEGIAKELKKYDEIEENIKNVDEMLEKKEYSTPSNREHYMELINLIINCKIFMMDLHSKGSEGSLIDIYSFIKNAPSFTAIYVLKFIFNLSKIQSKEMNKAIIEKIYNQHLENIEKLKKEYKNVIVESDGPVGLYAAFELFMEGMNVTVVSSRSNYANDMSFDTKWISTLRFLLGNEFEKKSEFTPNNRGKFLYIKDLKSSLKERLNVLSKYVKEKENGKENEKSFLEVLSDSKILDINAVDEKPTAILDKVDKEENDEIPFDLFFCDFIEEIKHGVVILNKKDFNKKILKEGQKSVNLDSKNLAKFSDLDKLTRESFFLSEEIRNRYYVISRLIRSNMKEEENNSESSKTRIGKVYKITPRKTIRSAGGTHNISVKIFETDKTIQIESDTPMAIVELIEEVKNEREKLRMMNKEEFKQKWEEIKNDTSKLVVGLNIDVEREKMLKKYDDFIVELKEEWFKDLFYNLPGEIYKNEVKPEVIIKLSKEKEKEKGEASTSNKVETIHDKDEHILYFNKNSLIVKPCLLKVYGKENTVKLFKGKKDSAIFVNLNDEETIEIHEGLDDVDKAVSVIKKYNKSKVESDLTKMLMDELKKTD